MEMILKEEGSYKAQNRTANRLLLMAVRRDLLPSMDETPQSPAPVTQVRDPFCF